ncbi:ATP-binding protein [Actinoplanes sp. L3-i22]|uniref:ATP-binding protein n=1 Tax=Actinoplanes sp. L3-i22 TaxID=2836373 RepID=UPI001C79A0B7|nr:ATP-binding protein [Actinoplanes sp. L3-i22]BCY09913.1 hypothetical protein L3i22_050010 [Actinoplanes sp. L3-i22]
MRIVGRRREQAAVLQLLDRAAAGIGGHLVLTGPAGAGKTTLARFAAAEATARGIPVEPADGFRGPRLIVLEDADENLIAGAASDSAAILATAREPLGLPPELRLTGLPEPDLADLFPALSPAGVHALWLVSGGLPGPALAHAADVAGLAPQADPVVELALALPSRAEILQLDAGLLRLLEEAVRRPGDPGTGARLRARLARELLGDQSAARRRQELVDEALTVARDHGDPAVLAEVLDHRLHALWDPAAAHERLATAVEIVDLARTAGDAGTERRGLFWSFVAWAELGRLDHAEAALTAYARAGELAGDAEAAVVVDTRQAMLATVRGRFEPALRLADRVAVRGRRAGIADTDRLVASLRGRVALLRRPADAEPEGLLELARRLPGHFFEASAARVLAELGRDAEAGLELDRLLPAVLAGSGPRWLGAVADLAAVAARSGDPAAAQALYDALLPYQGRLVTWGGANALTGPVDDYLGRLAARLGRHDLAVSWFDRAVESEQRIGALPWLAATLAARAAVLPDRDRAERDRARAREITRRLGMGPAPADGRWGLIRDGDGWQLTAGTESAGLRDARGVGFLRTLLAAPGSEIAALDLVAGGAGLRVPAAGPVLDETARRAYRRRLTEIDQRLAAADRAGDPDGGAAAQAERGALVAELRRATGTGGRARTVSDEAERARVNATRALRATVRRIERVAPLAGAHLSASLRTGRMFEYRPMPDGPPGWRLS